MAALYTLGEWTTKESREDDFVAAWRDLAEWTENNIRGSSWAKLLRDREDPRRFISFSPWKDDDAVAVWRKHPGFHTRVSNIQDLVETFVPHTMDVAAEIGPPTPDP